MVKVECREVYLLIKRKQRRVKQKWEELSRLDTEPCRRKGLALLHDGLQDILDELPCTPSVRTMKEKKFERGEKVWYYPLGKDRPKYRKEATILEVKLTVFGSTVYMVTPRSQTLFPTFVDQSVLEKR